MENNLPKGWALVDLGDIAKVEWGNTSITKKSYVESGQPAFSAAGQDGFLPRGEWSGEGIILSAIGARCGKCFFAEGGQWTAIKNTIVIQGIAGLISHKYLFYFLNDEKKWAIGGSGQPFITMGSAVKNKIPLPPSAEQKRIVAKLEKLLAKVNDAKDRLEIIPRILRRFRQSVLAAACSGRLTADWRKKNPKASLPESFKKKLPDESELPETWASVSVGDVITNLKYGTAKKCEYSGKGVPVLRIPNIGEGVVDHSDLKYATLDKKELESLRLDVGDILLIRSNGSVSLVGKTAIARKSENGFAYAGYLIRIRPNQQLVLPEYLNFAFSTFDVRLQIEVPARSTSGVNNINSDEVKKLRIAIGPLLEQEEIIRRVEKLFKLADTIEARYAKAKRFVDKLTQSILAKAFRGELVSQNPSDEPAEALLTRIKAERTKLAAEKESKQGRNRRKVSHIEI